MLKWGSFQVRTFYIFSLINYFCIHLSFDALEKNVDIQLWTNQCGVLDKVADGFGTGDNLVVGNEPENGDLGLQESESFPDAISRAVTE